MPPLANFFIIFFVSRYRLQQLVHVLHPWPLPFAIRILREPSMRWG